MYRSVIHESEQLIALWPSVLQIEHVYVRRGRGSGGSVKPSKYDILFISISGIHTYK